MELVRLKKRARKIEDDLDDKSGKRYERSTLTNCDGKKKRNKWRRIIHVEGS